MHTEPGSQIETYHFSGLVHPERTWLTLQNLQFELDLPVLSWQGSISFSLQFGQLSITCSSPQKIEDIASYKNFLESFAQNLVNILGFAWGRAYRVEIVSVVTVDGNFIVFGIEDPTISGGSDKRNELITPAINASINNPWLRRAMSELRFSISEPDDTGFHCQCAVEAMRHHFQGVGNDLQGWKIMRTSLRISEHTLRILSEFGNPQRHGASSLMSYEMRARDMSITWEITERFICLLDSGELTLKSDDYPLL